MVLKIDILVVNRGLVNPTPNLPALLVNHFKMRSDIKAFHLADMGCSVGLISLGTCGCCRYGAEEKGISSQQIDILVVDCGLFNPTPSLSALLVNHFKMRSNVKAFHFADMGCNAGFISLGLARDLLQVHRATTRYVLAASSEVIQAVYDGKERPTMVTNCLLYNYCKARYGAEEKGISSQQIDILVVDCGLFNPSPSLSALLVNHFKMRSDVKAFHFADMGCNAGFISLGLARDLLQVHRATTRSFSSLASLKRCMCLELTSSRVASYLWKTLTTKPKLLGAHCWFNLTRTGQGIASSALRHDSLCSSCKPRGDPDIV
ncbi:hypothetical protein L7F22_067128 [Adiantum nelumboides]|nr:hypothetical protein [Adiantum nelumboides]